MKSKVKREPSEQVKVAKIIRKELKKHGIDGKVTARKYAGGTSVDVNVIDQPWRTIEAINNFVHKFKKGKFNSMTDMYEYSDSSDELPSVTYIHVDAKYSQAYKSKALEALIASPSYPMFAEGMTMDNLPDYVDLPEHYIERMDTQSVLRGVLTGSLSLSYYDICIPEFVKPTISIPAVSGA